MAYHGGSCSYRPYPEEKLSGGENIVCTTSVWLENLDNRQPVIHPSELASRYQMHDIPICIARVSTAIMTGGIV
jgi:hypothetical protein